MKGRSVAAVMIATLGAFGARAETPLERGAYLVKGVVTCVNCHTAPTPSAAEFAGGRRFLDIAYTAISPNITPDPENGLASWTADQIVTAIREGRRPRGSIMGPPMPVPLYRGMSDTDAHAIATYLQSLPAVQSKIGKSSYRVPLPVDYGPPLGSVPDPDRSDKVSYGRYLATSLAACMACHSKPGEKGPDLGDGLGAGGRQFRGPWGVSLAPNLTPSGTLPSYSDEDLKKIITTGVRPDGSKLQPPMPVSTYAHMSDADVSAIVAYLRTLPPK